MKAKIKYEVKQMVEIYPELPGEDKTDYYNLDPTGTSYVLGLGDVLNIPSIQEDLDNDHKEIKKTLRKMFPDIDIE